MGVFRRRRNGRLTIIGNAKTASVATMIAGCGGGWGVYFPGANALPSGAPAPEPSAKPTPPPTPTASADTVEYKASGAIVSAKTALLAPIACDLMTGVPTIETTTVELEAGWSAAPAPTSSIRVGAAHASDAGHAAHATDAAGFFALALR